MFVLGLFLVIVGAFSVGTSMWPVKVCKVMKIEHIMFWSCFFGLFILPWIIMFSICNVGEFFSVLDVKNVILANCFSMAWGVANVICCICFVKIGIVLTSVLLGGTALIVSTLIPLVFKGSGVFAQAPNINSPQGMMSIIAVVFMFCAIILISVAGDLRDKYLGIKGLEEANLTDFQNNLYKFLAILSGIMSTGIFMLNTYCGDEILGAMDKIGADTPLKGVSIWAAGMFLGVMINVFYALYLMAKNKTFGAMKNFKETLFAMFGGLQFCLYLILFGFGTIMMGALGASIGNGVSQCVQTGGQQFLGFAFGEWKGVKGKPVKVLCAGFVFLVLGIVILSFK